MAALVNSNLQTELPRTVLPEQASIADSERPA